MTLAELTPALRAHLEQIGMDAGSLWSEAFREERGRDPEPEECDAQAAQAGDRLLRKARRALATAGIEPDATLLAEITEIIRQKFVDFSQDA